MIAELKFVAVKWKEKGGEVNVLSRHSFVVRDETGKNDQTNYVNTL